jgi:hypothetical protein
MYAFPSGHNPKTGTQESGMTLRDYFAAMAMQALLTNDKDAAASDSLISKGAYEMADAMMKARDL